MSSEDMIKFEMKDLVAAIEHLNANRSSDDNMEKLPSSPMHVLVYNQILQFSKEELEAPIKIRNRHVSLAEMVFTQRHGFFFSACIKKGAFHNLLSDESKWLLENFPDLSHQLMGAIHSLEKRSSKDLNEPKQLTFPIFMEILMGHYLYLFNTDEKKAVVDLILDKYAEKESKYLQGIVINEMPMYENHSATHEYIGRKLYDLGLVTRNLNGLLPHPGDYPDHKNDFNLNRNDVSKIQRLLKCGFRFNEEEYNYYGDNLFIALVKARNFNACEVILPHLSDVTPRSGSYIEQHAVIDSLAKTRPQEYKFIKSHYEKCLLNLELEQKPESAEKVRKAKI